LCDGTVRFVLARDSSGSLRFASLQSSFATAIIASHAELTGVDSMVWVEGPLVLTRSSAAIRLAWYLGGAWRLAEVLRLVPRPVRDWAYDLLARHRHRLAGSARRAFVAPADVRNRFLDGP
jgi:predicted DCC family thiol-disulfide oxidoreductase YuxK